MLFIAGRVGTGRHVVVRLDPPFEQDPDGNDVTIAVTWDPFRPDCVIVGAWQAQDIPGHGFIVNAPEMTVAPEGTVALGDPTVDSTVDATPTRTDKNRCEDLAGRSRNAFSEMTRRQIIEACLAHQSEWVTRFVGRGG